MTTVLLHYTIHSTHIALIAFNLFGWIPRPTARYNLIMLLLTGLSWTCLGYFYGFGYCPLTDWHYQILESMGRHDLPPSYIAFLIADLSGIEVRTSTADWITGVSYCIALIGSTVRNVLLWKNQSLRGPSG